jgi:hypothetical protein
MHRPARLFPALSLLAVAACGNGLDSRPRIQSIPDQKVTSGASLALDLAPYVFDKETGVTFSVVAGGGSFAGSVYSNTFATMGTYEVTVRATDASAKSEDAKFEVVVTTADYAVAALGDDLALLDAGTGSLLPLAGGAGTPETFRAALARGPVVYERDTGASKDLYAFDPFTRRTHTLGNDPGRDELYVGRTTDHRVVFTAGTASDVDLYVWNAVTGLVRTISAVAGEHDRNALVNAADLVFYERGNGGQADVWCYDPEEDASTVIADGPTHEAVRAVLPDGALVLSRIGAGGETDLYWYRAGTGLVEIGADLSSTVQNQSKTWRGATNDGKVVFEVQGTTEIDLYVWDSQTGASRLVSGSDTGDSTFAAVTPIGEVVYQIAAGPTDANLAIYDWGTNLRTIIASSGVDEVYEGAFSNGDVVYRVESGSGIDLYLFDTSASSSTGFATASASDYEFQRVLGNDHVVYTNAAGGLHLYDGTTVTNVDAGDAAFGGETGGGDFVWSLTTGGQTDLYLWDESAGSSVTISDQAGNDAFGGWTGGKVVVLRAPTGQATADLFLWNLAGGLVRITTTATAHTVVGTYSADADG